MSYDTTLSDLDQPYMTSEIVDKYPFKNHWRNNPLSPITWIESRQAGYRPYGSLQTYQEREPLENKCSVYQTSCDIITPVNSCYKKHPEPVFQP